MINEIPKIEMPNWLLGEKYKFDIKNIIIDSLYYPSCGTDGVPVKYFMGNIYSFVYVDYGISENDFNREIDLPEAFRGYKIIHKEKISKYQLDTGNEKYYLAKISHREPMRDWVQKTYCYWVVFKRELDYNDTHNPEYFSLLYLCSEAVSAYYVLYNQYKVSPKILCIIQDGHGFGGNWTDFTDRNLDLARAVFINKKLPEYLINGGYGTGYEKSIWPEYKKLIYKKTDYDSYGEQKSFSLWDKGENDGFR
jgi:hypothetical protein